MLFQSTPPPAAPLPAGDEPAPGTPGPGPGRADSPRAGKAITAPRQPRRLLALRVRAALEGSILRPEKRAALLHLGQRLGLTPFEANLVIAIVQDRARRPVLPARPLPPAAPPDALLSLMSPLPKPASSHPPAATNVSTSASRRPLVLTLAAVILLAEALACFWII